MKLHRAIKLFLNEKIPTTAKSYRPCLDRLSGWIGTDRPVAIVKPIDLLEYKQDSIDVTNWANATKRKHIRTIKTFFNWCVKLELIEKSPAASLKEPKVQTRISREKAMTDGELQNALEFAKHKFNKRDYALCLFVADTGCRAGGASNLRISDLDLANNLALVTEKGDKTRYVYYGAVCKSALIALLAKRSPNDGEHVFGSVKKPKGTQVKADNLSQAIRRVNQAVGNRSKGSHSLRHRKGFALADACTAESDAADVMGHEDFRVTRDNYYPPAVDRLKAANEALTVGYNKPDNVSTEQEEQPRIIQFPDETVG